MDIRDKTTVEIVRRLQNARMALLKKQPFFALLLMRMKFSLDTACHTFYTDGTRLAFNPEFLEKLSDGELEFVLKHGALHAALGHPFRVQADYELVCYDMACDIVVNSNILHSEKMNPRSITIKGYGVAMHKTPSGEEGYKHTVEEVYEELLKKFGHSKKSRSSSGAAEDAGDTEAGDQEDAADGEADDATDETDDAADGAEGAGDGEAGGQAEAGAANQSGGKSGKSKKAQKGRGKGSPKEGGAATLGEGTPWKDPNDYDLEGLLSQLKAKNQQLSQQHQKELAQTKKSPIEEMTVPIDDHSFWQGDDEDNTQRALWQNYVMQATDAVMEKKNAHKGYGGPPLCTQRLVEELTRPEVDWRVVLNDFVQEEINDYSFSPPDKRMGDCPFFLPDFNEKEERVKNVWFLIDTSGSIGDKEIAAAYSEIVSAIDMFQGKLEGLLSFTEVFVTDPIPFCSQEELLAIKPIGGGGNDFGEIFRYLERNLMDDPPVSIVIFTDGYDDYPEESAALGIPVMWLINNQEAEPPPWGKWARFKVNE